MVIGSVIQWGWGIRVVPAIAVHKQSEEEEWCALLYSLLWSEC
jgi:hypothetical protein